MSSAAYLEDVKPSQNKRDSEIWKISVIALLLISYKMKKISSGHIWIHLRRNNVCQLFLCLYDWC